MHYMLPPRVLPFRWIVPVGQLFLCMLLVGTAMLPLGIVSWAYREHIFEVVTGLNLPGGLVQLPEVIFTGTLQIWKPEGIDFRLWGGITGRLFWDRRRKRLNSIHRT